MPNLNDAPNKTGGINDKPFVDGLVDWQQVDLVVAKIRAAGNYWSLAVLAGLATPNWLYETPYMLRVSAICFKAMKQSWHPAIHERLRLLALAMAEKYANDLSLMLGH